MVCSSSWCDDRRCGATIVAFPSELILQCLTSSTFIPCHAVLLDGTTLASAKRTAIAIHNTERLLQVTLFCVHAQWHKRGTSRCITDYIRFLVRRPTTEGKRMKRYPVPLRSKVGGHGLFSSMRKTPLNDSQEGQLSGLFLSAPLPWMLGLVYGRLPRSSVFYGVINREITPTAK